MQLLQKITDLHRVHLFLAMLTIWSSFIPDWIQAQTEDFRVLNHWLKFTDIENVAYHHLRAQAIDLIEQREQRIQQINSADDWKQHQRSIRKVLNDIVGPFPERTPLNARVTDIVQQPQFRLEKVIFESLPGFYVTAGLFIPQSLSEPAPAILYCSGHSTEAFRSRAYQHVILNLVSKGFIVFAFDPIGQGERLAYFDPVTGQSRVGGATKEHSYPGAQCFVAGYSLARYMIWDGVRAIDYLLTRPEVDPSRIGLTGRSGGGTQSAYLAAFDKRIAAAAPECYITSFRRLFESIGPQDAEQNFYHGLAAGIDHADLIAAFAPKPVLLITTTRDFFSIQGARETFKELKQLYQALGVDSQIEMVEDDDGHASTLKNREAMYAFFQKHLNLPGDATDRPVEQLSSEALKVSQTGQVISELNGETIFSLNKKWVLSQISGLTNSRRNLARHLKNLDGTIKNLAGFIEPMTVGKTVFTGRFQRDGYTIEKYFMPGEGAYVIPFLYLCPDNRTDLPAIIYLHPRGKSAVMENEEAVEKLLKRGFAVVVPDLLGTGELGPGRFKGDAYDYKELGKAAYNLWFATIQIGRSLVGIQAGDVLRLIQFLKSREAVNSQKIGAVAYEMTCPVLLHAAAFDNSLAEISLFNPLIAYKALALNEFYDPRYIPWTVAGALTEYDLADLLALIAPRKVTMCNVLDQKGEMISLTDVATEYEWVRQIYQDRGQAENFSIIRTEK